MKKEIDFTIKVNGTVQVDVPDHLLQVLEDNNTLNYIYKGSRYYQEGLSDLEMELYDLINDEIDFDCVGYNEIEIDDVNDVDNED